MSKLIVFEGIDRSGKTTQVKKLYDHFTALKLGFYITREPCNRNVRFELKNGNLSPKQQLELILKDRCEHCHLTKHLLESADLVLCDRFTGSTFAYQGYGYGLDLDVLRELNEVATGGIKPDMTILFDCPVDVAIKRNFGKPLDRVEQDLHFLDRVRFGYLELARENDWVVIDATRSECQIFTELLGIIPAPVAG
jgi:dTMP kinase